jgi:nucleotide-binding universal stress UspA family protein
MSASYDLKAAVPGTDVPDPGDGPSFRRIFVPVRWPGESVEAAALLDEALLIVWGGGAGATTAVVDAPRGEVAAAIAQQASAWRADVIVLTRCRRPAISRLVLGSVADQVMHKASCPVLTVHPKRK